MGNDLLLTDAVSGNDVIFTDAVSGDDAFSPMRSVIITCASALNTECSEGKIQYWGRSFLYWNLWGISHKTVKQWKQNYHVHKIVTHMVTLYQKKDGFICGFSFCLEVIRVDTTAKYIILSLKRCYHKVTGSWILEMTNTPPDWLS